MPLGSTVNENTFLLKLYRVAHEMPICQFQESTLQLIKQVLPFDSSMWGSASTHSDGLDIHRIHLHQKSPEVLEIYEPLKRHDTAAAAMLGQREATCGFHAESWFAESGPRELFLALKKFGQENFFITSNHNLELQFVEWITLFRADADAHCTPTEINLLSNLAPHVMQAQSFNRMIHLRSMDISNTRKRGAAVADLRGVMYHTDDAFEDIVDSEWGSGKKQKLPVNVLMHFLQCQSNFIGRTLVMSHHTEHNLLFLKVRPRCGIDNLSPREKTVAKLIAKGNTHKEIAQLLNRAPATVRNHIQTIYGKLRINNVAELIEELQNAN